MCTCAVGIIPRAYRFTARGHATSYGTCIDSIVLSVAKIIFPLEHVKLRTLYGYGRAMESILAKDECCRFLALKHHPSEE